MVAVPSSDPARLCDALGKRDIVTSFRDRCMRASFHFYNDESDVDALIAAMRERRDADKP